MAIGGSKHFGFVKLRPDLQPVKVVTVTLGHPVVRHLLWKRTTTPSLRNNNPMFDATFDQILLNSPVLY